MSTIVIIPARGGSKGIPRKNLIDFCGRPLLAWSILQAREASVVAEVYVSSNDQEILGVAEEYGAVGITRPPELATDSSSSEAALLHAMDHVEGQGRPLGDAVVFLQATSPLREPSDIDGAVGMFRDEGADSLFSMCRLDDFCIWHRREGKLAGLSYDPDERWRRQDREPLFLENGSIYVFEPKGFRERTNRLGGHLAMYEMPLWKSWEIDTEAEIDLCAFYFRKHGLDRLGGAPDHIRRSAVDLVVYDFDGVMTDNRAVVMEDGREGVLVNRADGMGVERLRKLKVPQIVLSTEENPVVAARAAKLGLEAIQGCRDKERALVDLCAARGIDLRRVVYVGNDTNDLGAMGRVGYPVAPSDAHPDVASAARFQTRAAGGAGVVREVSELIRQE